MQCQIFISDISFHLLNTFHCIYGPRLWKFHNSLTEKKDFVKYVKTHINKIKSNFDGNFSHQTRQEFLKYQIHNSEC